MHRSILTFFLLLIPFTSIAQMCSLQYVDTKTDASFRGLSVAGNAVWVTGSKGCVGRSINGGSDWTFLQVPGYEKCDFRTIYALDANNAVIANAGSPAYILRTSDGGANWQLVYKNTDSAAFIDGADFWNDRCGIMHGDPINGRPLLLYTRNGGRTWKERWKWNSPKMNEGEASFAASGTSIRCLMNWTVVIATGGKTSKLLLSRNRGRRWRTIPTPMLGGANSTGIYSFMPWHSVWHWLIAGGDYKHDTVQTANFFYSPNKGKKWLAPEQTTRGYRECIAAISDHAKRDRVRAMFAVGPTGIDISTDGGINWKPLSDEKGFHVIKPSSDHNGMFLAGSNGKLAIMKTSP
ncbi:MAG: hypothetical protein K9G49_07565 [Taibaiella sp.]|nr:hypothetical protein [Taibaiella sp.]